MVSVQQARSANEATALTRSDEGPAASSPGLSPFEGRKGAIGRYQLREILGQGGMGTVYLAEDPQLERSLALKLVRDDLIAAGMMDGTSEDRLHRARKRMLREGKAMAKLRHPNVIAVFDVGELRDQIYLASEYMAGGSLRDWMSKESTMSPQSWRCAYELLRQAGEGLAAAHAAGLTHRDFKPDNVLLGASGEVKVGDFGLVKLEGERLRMASSAAWQDTTQDNSADSESQHQTLDESLTRAGVHAGTPAYMAPEHMDGLRVDARSDLFSFCVTAYELLFGVKPFSHRIRWKRRRDIEYQQLQRPRIDRKVPRWLRRLVLRGLLADPEARPVSMRALLDELESTRRRVEIRRRRCVQAGALAAATGLVGTWLSTREAPPPETTCDSGETHTRGLWSHERRRTVRRAFTGTHSAIARDTWTRVDRAVTSYIDAWQGLYRETCEAARDQGPEAAADLDLQVSCLMQRRTAVDGLATTFERADDATVEQAMRATAALPAIADCADLEDLRRGFATSVPPALRKRANAILGQMPAISTRVRAGDRRALEEAETLRERAAVLELPALDARAWELVSESYMEIDDSHNALDVGAAIERWRTTLVTAQAARERAIVAHASAWLMYLEGYLAADWERGRELATPTWSYIEAADFPVPALGNFYNARGILAGLAGEHDRAIDSFERMYDTYARARGLSDDDAIAALGNLAWAHSNESDFASAARLNDLALEQQSQKLGSNHPMLQHYHSNASHYAFELGRWSDAVEHGERALAICRDRPGTVNCSTPVNALVRSLRARGGYPRARALLDTIREQQAQTGRRSNPHLNWAEVALAQVELFAGRARKAHELASIGLRRLEAETGVLDFVGDEARLRMAAAERSLLNTDAALRRLEAMTAPKNPDYRARWMRGTGLARLIAGSHELATMELEQAFELERSRSGDEPNPNLAPYHLSLALGLDATQRIDEAIDHVGMARHLLEVVAEAPDHPALAICDELVGRLALRRNDWPGAVEAFQRAEARFDPTRVLPHVLADLHFGLAIALDHLGPDRQTLANDRAHRALAAHRARDVSDPSAQQRIETWLKSPRERRRRVSIDDQIGPIASSIATRM